MDYTDLGLDCLASVIWVSKLPMRGHPARGGSNDLAFYLGALAEIDEKADLFAGQVAPFDRLPSTVLGMNRTGTATNKKHPDLRSAISALRELLINIFL